jgi:hypothetical protein
MFNPGKTAYDATAPSALQTSLSREPLLELRPAWPHLPSPDCNPERLTLADDDHQPLASRHARVEKAGGKRLASYEAGNTSLDRIADRASATISCTMSAAP